MNNIVACIFLILCTLNAKVKASQTQPADTLVFPLTNLPRMLPGTKLLDTSGDLSAKMMAGAHRFIEREIGQSLTDRSKRWHRNLVSKNAYDQSVEPHRKRLMKIIGVEDK